MISISRKGDLKKEIEYIHIHTYIYYGPLHLKTQAYPPRYDVSRARRVKGFRPEVTASYNDSVFRS